MICASAHLSEVPQFGRVASQKILLQLCSGWPLRLVDAVGPAVRFCRHCGHLHLWGAEYRWHCSCHGSAISPNKLVGGHRGALVGHVVAGERTAAQRHSSNTICQNWRAPHGVDCVI